MVTFMDGDTEWKSVQVEDGELCEKPTPDPVRAGYTFEYWCSDRGDPEASKFQFRVPIRKNLTLWAQWRRDPKVVLHKVIFDTQEAGKIDTVEVEDGKAVAEPAAPVRAGYDFKGWYTDKDCTAKYNFSTLVTSDTHLYAKWESNGKPTFKVTFHSNGGSEVPEQQVEENWKVQRPKNPVWRSTSLQTGMRMRGSRSSTISIRR
jgi:internalin